MGDLVLSGLDIIDGIRDEIQPNRVVVVAGERIAKIGPVGDFGGEWPPGTQVLDLTGFTALPGLINCHDHLDVKHAPGSFQERVTQPKHYLALRASRNALITLAGGVTTVRDMASTHACMLFVRDAITDGLIVGPRVFSNGRAISMTGGHGHQRAWEADGPDAVRTAARTLLRMGADLVKVMASGGMTQIVGDAATAAQLTVTEMRAAFDEAHRAGKPTAAHAHPPLAIQQAIEAGVDCIEHALFLDQPTAELMARKGVFLVPTLSEGPGMLRRGAALGRPSALIAREPEVIKAHEAAARYAVAAGVAIGCGTDGLGDMVEELELLVAAGLSPAAALRAATSTAAQIVHAPDLGALRPDALADIVVIRGNPLQSFEALRDIRLVVKAGHPFDPAVLSQAIGKVPA